MRMSERISMRHSLGVASYVRPVDVVRMALLEVGRNDLAIRVTCNRVGAPKIGRGIPWITGLSDDDLRLVFKAALISKDWARWHGCTTDYATADPDEYVNWVRTGEEPRH